MHLDAIYRYHPLFANEPHETWSDRLGGPAQLEGGDVLVVGNGCLLIGMGERTRPAGSSSWRRLFDAGAAASHRGLHAGAAVEHAWPVADSGRP